LVFAVDPSAQQLIEFVDCPEIDKTLKGHPSRIEDYLNNAGHMEAARSAIDPPIASAIGIGVYAPPASISSLVDPKCPTGNCTFNLFFTVGVCSECQDISSQIRVVDSDPSWNIKNGNCTITMADSLERNMSLWASISHVWITYLPDFGPCNNIRHNFVQVSSSKERR
jgi:hypothetical protein